MWRNVHLQQVISHILCAMIRPAADQCNSKSRKCKEIRRIFGEFEPKMKLDCF